MDKSGSFILPLKAVGWWLMGLGCFRLLMNARLAWWMGLPLDFYQYNFLSMKLLGCAELCLGFYIRTAFPRRRVAERMLGALIIYLLMQMAVTLLAALRMHAPRWGEWCAALISGGLGLLLLWCWRRGPGSLVKKEPEITAMLK